MQTASLLSPAALGFVRAAVISPELRVADVAFNTQAIVAALREAAGQGCRLALFPELCTDRLLVRRSVLPAPLLDGGGRGAGRDRCEAQAVGIAVVVGLPLEVDGKLFNCAALIADGRVLGIVPKTYLPTTNEFYEERWFTPGSLAARNASTINGRRGALRHVTCSSRRTTCPDCVIGIEICEDLWAVNPPSGDLALAGATVLLNVSASNELLGKVDYRRDLVRQQSARCLAAYLYAGAGPGESTTDLVLAGHSLIAENGALLAETERFRFDTQLAMADVDVERLVHERLRNNAFGGRARRPRLPPRAASLCPAKTRGRRDEP